MALENYKRVRKSFQYQPLSYDPENPTIRVVELLAGSPPWPIRCYLRHVSLSSCPKYEALSYCWGSSIKSRSIVCSTCALGITESLYAALMRLRLYNRSRYLWVDAICINQEDDDEKSHQFVLMGKIYQSAQSVVVWLGEQAEHSELLENFVPVLLEAKRKTAAANDARTLKEMTAVDREYYGIPHWIYNGGSKKYFALSCIASRPWFSRIWIVQEISLAADAVIYCGGWNMPWNSLIDAFNFVQEIAFDIFQGLFDGQNMQVLQWSRARVAKGGGQNLLSLLLRHQSAQATDPKDKIYGLLGLASDSCMIEVKTSNVHSVEEIYIDLARAFLVQGQNLDILSVAHCHVDVDGEHDDLPSWVPDWSVGSHVLLPLLQEVGNQVSLSSNFYAAGRNDSRPIPQVNGNLLTISGQIVDKIVACGLACPLPIMYDVHSLNRGAKTTFKELENEAVLHSWEKVAQARSGELYVTKNSTILSAYWHTLCAFSDQGEDEQVTRAFIAYDNFDGLSRSLNKFLLDTLDLDYRNWPFKVLSIVFGLMIVFFRVLRRTPFPDSTFQNLMYASRGRKMVRTEGGYLGLASEFVNVGDKIGLFPGSKVPLIIRRKEQYWQLLGEAYIHGMMQGECFVKDECYSMVFC